MAAQLVSSPAVLRPPFFIFGCGRSGTSLLSRMLDSHPGITVPHESHLYNRFYPLLPRSADLGNPRTRERLLARILATEHMRLWTPPPALGATLAAVRRPDFHGIVEALLDTWTRSQGKARWGEKTPHHTLWWRTILAGFPDLRVVHLVRDGRDVALSFKSAPFGPKHVYQAARHWAHYLAAAEDACNALGPTGFLQVRYEDLLADPEGELRRICAFLGEEYHPDLLTFHRRQQSDYPTDRRNADSLRRPLLSENTQKWRTGLTAREVRIFEAVAGDRLERYGYAMDAGRPRISTPVVLSCRYLEHPPRRLVAMLTNPKGHRFALETIRLNLTLRLGL